MNPIYRIEHTDGETSYIAPRLPSSCTHECVQGRFCTCTQQPTPANALRVSVFVVFVLVVLVIGSTIDFRGL